MIKIDKLKKNKDIFKQILKIPIPNARNCIRNSICFSILCIVFKTNSVKKKNVFVNYVNTFF